MEKIRQCLIVTIGLLLMGMQSFSQSNLPYTQGYADAEFLSGTDNSVWMKSALDIGVGYVGFLGPIGFGVSATYFYLMLVVLFKVGAIH